MGSDFFAGIAYLAVYTCNPEIMFTHVNDECNRYQKVTGTKGGKENLTTGERYDYFSDGLTEEMITELARLSSEHLGVIARPSAMQFKSTTKGVRQIGRALEWLERAYQEHNPDLIELTREPSFASLRSDAKFRELTERIGWH